MRRRAILAGLPALLIALLAAPAAPAPPLTLPAADRLAALPASRDRDRALEKWAAAAPLPDLLYVLRRPGLGALEPRLLSRALERVPEGRRALARRLTMRLAQADPGRARRLMGALAGDVGALARRAAASPYRVGTLLPENGDYAAYAHALLLGLEAGFALEAARGGPRLELERWGAGADEPAHAAASFDSATVRDAVVVGQLLSVPTLALAAAARIAETPLISPTATDESIGESGPTVFQIGPSSWERGAVLARQVLGERGVARVAVLLSSDEERGGLAAGFVATAETLGCEVVWRGTYAPGNLNFASESQALLANRAEVLFWDGDSREAEALLRRLAQDRVSLRVAGGEGLAPEQFHPEARTLLEGVRYVADDWQLGREEQAALDSAIRASGEVGAARASLVARGYLTARFIAAAVREGALCPEEIAAALARSVARESGSRAHRFLDCARLGASLPVLTVSRGRSAPAQ